TDSRDRREDQAPRDPHLHAIRHFTSLSEAQSGGIRGAEQLPHVGAGLTRRAERHATVAVGRVPAQLLAQVVAVREVALDVALGPVDALVDVHRSGRAVFALRADRVLRLETDAHRTDELVSGQVAVLVERPAIVV